MIRMKPETLARREIERARDRREAAIVRRARLAELAKRDGDGSIWAELLAIEHAVAAEAH